MAITENGAARRAARAPRPAPGRGRPADDELGAILEAVSKVAELDLADVPPTSHPLDLVNVWADDEPRPSLSLDEALANAPAREGDLFRVPPTAGPEVVGVIDTLRLTAEEALGLLERREVSAAELHAAYSRRRRARRRAPRVPPARRGSARAPACRSRSRT